ncbi:MAG: S9 family peptidase [Myxococcales bacterium]|nr:S9 family peptidase [Myxococcales bacterium]
MRRAGNLTYDGIPALPPALAARARPYFGARHSRFVDWGRKGKTLLVRTRFGNTRQVHLVAAPLGMRRQLTFFREPIARAAFYAGAYDNALLLKMDRGGAENHQLYRLDLLEGTTRRLTDGRSRHLGFRFSRRGLLAFSANARNGRDFDIYLLKPGSDQKPTRVFDGKGYFETLDISRDERKLLLLQYISINESYLHLLDIATRKATLLTPKGQGPVSYLHGRFGRRGRTAYVTSDRDGKFVKLYALDLAKRTFKPISAKIDWDVTGLDVSDDGSSVAFVVNADGLSKLYFARTSGAPRVRLAKNIPAGVIRDVAFSRGGRLAFTLATATAPDNVYAYAPRRRKLVGWTASEIGGLRSDLFVKPKLIRYPTFDKREIPAFYYKPAGKGPFPVVLMIHGGPESQYRPTYSPLIQYLLREMKVAVLCPNVRGSRGYGKAYLLLDNGRKREDSVKDIGALLDWIKAQKELDAKRVALHGGSYGGYMVLATMAMYPGRVRAGVDWVGISNFVTFLEHTKAYRRDLRRAEYGDERDATMAKFLRAISPLSKVGKIRAPLLVIQGANDPRVPRSEAEQIVKALRARGKTVWYLLAHDEGHGFRKQRNRIAARLATIAFLERYLKR